MQNNRLYKRNIFEEIFAFILYCYMVNRFEKDC